MMIASSSLGAQTPPLSFSSKKRKTNWKFSSSRRLSASSSSSSSSTTTSEESAVLLAHVQEKTKKKEIVYVVRGIRFGFVLIGAVPGRASRASALGGNGQTVERVGGGDSSAMKKEEEKKEDDDDDGNEYENNSFRRQRLPVVLGLDCEWKPGDNTPVSLFQVATRERVFVGRGLRS